MIPGVRKKMDIPIKKIFLGNFFEFLYDGRLEICRQVHTTEDAGEDLFHGCSARGVLTNSQIAFWPSGEER